MACAIRRQVPANGFPQPRSNDIEQLFSTLQRANASIYAFSPSGLEVCANPSAGALRTFAEETGGRAVLDTNAPWDGVPQVFAETSAYYLLAFRSADFKEDGRFHDIKVKVDRPDLDVRTRSGYFTPKAVKSAKPSKNPPSPLDVAMAAGFPDRGLPLSIDASVLPTAGTERSDVAVVVGVSGDDVESAGTHRLTVAATAYDKNWKASGEHRETVEATRRPDDGRLAPTEVISHLELKPGRYELRVGVEAGGRTGSVFTDLEVPDARKKGLYASEPLLDVTPETLEQPPRDLEALVPITPTVRRKLQPTDEATVFLRIVQGGRDTPMAVPMEAVVVDEHGRTVLDQSRTIPASRFDGDREADYRFPLPLARLPPGAYLLRVTLGADDTSLERTLRFTVEKP